MTSPYEADSPAFCGNCGTPVEAEASVCSFCNHRLFDTNYAAESRGQFSGAVPPDYIPYCRQCGIIVDWGTGFTCGRCGLTPLCEMHFQMEDKVCLDCAAAPYQVGAAAASSGLRCAACGAFVASNEGFCANCGRALLGHAAGTEYMGFWIRFAAFIIDWIAAYILAVVIAVAIGFSITADDASTSLGEQDVPQGRDVEFTLESINFSFLLLYWGISVGHTLILTAWRGQTLGKMILKLQVVDANGNLPPPGRVLAREAVRAVVLLALIPLCLVYLWVAFDRRKRGLQDYAGACYVVRRPRSS